MEVNKRRGDTWRMLLVISAVVLAGGVLFAWSRILFPVLAAFLIAWITHPLASFFARHRLPQILGFLVFLRSSKGCLNAHSNVGVLIFAGWMSTVPQFLRKNLAPGYPF